MRPAESRQNMSRESGVFSALALRPRRLCGESLFPFATPFDPTTPELEDYFRVAVQDPVSA